MLNQSGVFPFLFLLETALFSELQCSHTVHCSALLLVQMHMCAEPSLLPCRRTETALTSSFCLPAVLRLSLGLRFFPLFSPSSYTSNTEASLKISRFQLPQLIVPFNIIFYAERVEFYFSCFKDFCHSLLFWGSHSSSLLILPLCSLSTFFCWRGVALTFSPFLCLTTFIPFLASALKHIYWSKSLCFLKSNRLYRELQQTDKIILVVFSSPSSYFSWVR